MNLKEIQNYLRDLSVSSTRDMNKWLGLGLDIPKIEVTVRPLLMPTLTINGDNEYHALIPQPIDLPPGLDRWTTDVEKKDFSQMEFEAVHEFSHVLHSVASPRFTERRRRESEVVRQKEERTPLWDRFLEAGEFVAEYIAHYYFGERDGASISLAKSSGSGTGVYQDARAVYSEKFAAGEEKEFARNILRADLEDLEALIHEATN